MFARASQAQAVVPGARRAWPRLPWRWLAAGLLALLITALLAGLLARLTDPGTLPITRIRVEGRIAHLDEAMLRRAVAGRVQGGFFGVDVAAVRAAVEALPWVDRARVRRIWPDTLQIRVTEQVPVAIWNDTGLVNRRGGVFRPQAATWPADLPRLYGPAGRSAWLAGRYREFAASLQPAGLGIAALRVDARGAVRLRLANGIEVVLGREARSARLARFVRVWRKALAAEAARIARVDLRYGSGLAVQWKPNGTQTRHEG